MMVGREPIDQSNQSLIPTPDALRPGSFSRRTPTRSVPLSSSSSSTAAVSLSRVKETDRSTTLDAIIITESARGTFVRSFDRWIVRVSADADADVRKQTNKETNACARARAGSVDVLARRRVTLDHGRMRVRTVGWDLGSRMQVRGVRTFGTHMISRFIRRFIYTVRMEVVGIIVTNYAWLSAASERVCVASVCASIPTTVSTVPRRRRR